MGAGNHLLPWINVFMMKSLAFPNFSLFLVTVEMIECSFFDPIVDEYFNIFYLASPRKNGVKIRNP